MYIIVKKDSRVNFHPHYNRTMGKYYGDKAEYLSDMKKQGLEPYNPKNVKKREPMKYKPSQWAVDVAKAIQRNDGKGGVVQDQLKKVKVKDVPKEIMKSPKGGWF